MLGLFQQKGFRLNFSLIGRGPRVLFLHCPGVRGTFWIPQFAALSSTFTCLRCEYPRDASWREAIAALLDHLHWPDCHLVGHGLGAHLILDFAFHHPSRARSLALLCPTTTPLSALPLTQLASPAEVAEHGEVEIRTHLSLLCGPQDIRPESFLDLAALIPVLPTLLLTTQHQSPHHPPNTKHVHLPRSSYAAPILASTEVSEALTEHLQSIALLSNNRECPPPSSSASTTSAASPPASPCSHSTRGSHNSITSPPTSSSS